MVNIARAYSTTCGSELDFDDAGAADENSAA